MKKVLVITYYWPPSGGAGVQRWLKFVKYLRDFGWEPIVYTPSNGEIPVEDTSLLKDVPKDLTIIKKPIWEPYSIYKLFIGQKKGEKINTGFLTEQKKPKFTEKISVWIRGNFFIPDARRFWIKPSIHFLSEWLRNNPVDAMISTGPPHSMHLIALGLKKKLHIPWMADFRDPWTNIDFYKDLMLTPAANKKHHQQELDVITHADSVISIGQQMSDEFAGILGKQKEKFKVITNGYDEDDVALNNITLDKKFSIAYIGTMVKTRNPIVLWDALHQLISTNSSLASALEIKLVGKVDVSANESIKKAGLEKFITRIDYLPHNEVIRYQQQSQVLLLIINNTKNAAGILTGKFFEYLSAQRPILCIGPEDGEAARILKDTGAGDICGFADVEKMKLIITELYKKYQTNSLNVSSKGIAAYSRKNLTGQLATILDSIKNK